MPGPIYLQGDRLSLRAVEPDDHAFIRRYWNNPDLRHWFPIARPLQGAYLADFLESSDENVPFLPCRDGDPVGFLWLFDIDEVAGRCEIGYWIRPEERQQGYATEAAALAVRYAVDERRLHKIMARVFDGNTPSRRVLETVGFTHEGHLRDHYYIDGEYVDASLFGLLADEHIS
ncbi:GNAT family N-acetyltransferase [Natronolimnobius sp. AArcel1]|uniref:GNAT family N-acetyltransferase n=1 Tax=Natronolimnobius sp. AArcel1 TaxID=1679093 RepID=UPI0013E9EA6D|nr:GNAT family protein [Natronolimnobius sp. AArcel1]NGM70642.1 GNAT family N-acetyltransferase [Natronolimnobius sp. AArcel1]